VARGATLAGAGELLTLAESAPGSGWYNSGSSRRQPVVGVAGYRFGVERTGERPLMPANL